MVMAATRSVVRASAPAPGEPGAVLARVNDNLCPDIPENMFVTCFYGVLDRPPAPAYANAGHNLPLVTPTGAVSELRATGMPLGLMPGSSYEERETTLVRARACCSTATGLIEAHDASARCSGPSAPPSVLADAATRSR